MKVFCDISYVWQRALLQRSKGVDEGRIRGYIEVSTNYALERFHKDAMSKISDGQDHIVRFVKKYWTEETIYTYVDEVGMMVTDDEAYDVEWLKSLNPYDVYFMIDEENQLKEARNLLFPKDSFSMTVLKHNYKNTEITEETYHRNCATCLYYDGEKNCPGCAPCLYWGGGVMFNDYCSRWEENILKK